ncbi:MAG: UvrD-helicase domain-containing protein [Cyclobacteriaceae bacterium]|nr:UvrD-helicase domain-containing protein [Cyclobacteriaceae bacterium]
MSETFSIYRSSAGSGKTRTLAKEYLKLALRSRADYFKHILAVTFTNKSTQEMKDRILAYLDDFANNRDNDLAEELRAELKLDASTFQLYAQETQAEILHKYAQFSISTIDAFFQKVIRSFTREAGLVGDYRLEVEQEPIMEEVIDNLMDELGSNEQLTKWVVDFANENLENERAWDVRSSLIKFSEEIFKEEFREIEGEVIKATAHPNFFSDLLTQLRKRKFEFTNFVTSKAKEALTLIHDQNLIATDFKYGGGVYNWFLKISKHTSVKQFDEKEIGKRPLNEYQSSKNFPDKDTIHRGVLTKLADEKLIPLLNDILTYREANYKTALSAEVALSNFYSFGLITDISRKLKEYKDENGIMLLADAPRFLDGVIQDSDTPFIYEKVGSFYRNYLIDEFQDTSGMQWKNFLPLLANGLDQGYPSMVVGDVKQAIYRWRGGDLNLLQQKVEQEVGAHRVGSKELNHNYRSASAIVEFNNTLFKSLSTLVASETGKTISTEAYADVAQQIHKTEQGFVSITLLKDEEDRKWREMALGKIPEYLERLQGLGVTLKDIAILVRDNRDGQLIVQHLLQYKNSEEAKPECRYEVVSNESLRLDGASSVNLLISALHYLLNPENAIARAQLGYEYARLHEPERALTDVFAVTNQVDFENNLPESFTKRKATLKKMPLFELTESLVELFDLGKITGELAYLQSFQDLVLEFSTRERNDMGIFLEWWEAIKFKKSIQVSGEVDAVQILTVHKAKGLQFKYVLIPFCAWDLDHGFGRDPNLWVQSKEVPFDKAGHLPVKYSSTLDDTVFSEYYKEERSRSYLDNLNLLYVALTRAEQGLMVMAPNTKKGTVASLLIDGIQQSQELKSGWDEATQTWSAGSWSIAKEKNKKVLSVSIELNHYPATSWRDQLVIRQTAKGFFNKTENETFEKVRYGIHIHTILAKVKYQNEWEEVLERLVSEGLISLEEKPRIYELMTELLSNSLIASWFSESWKVRTEVPVIIPGGGDNRIDRLMTNGSKAVVVDFKTGEPAKADQHQVAEYIAILHQMNFTEVEGYLLYTKTGDVVSVPPGKISKSKKKDDKQLGLGF